ncbi:MAG: tyrosine-type recombinase/integrase [archaeon]
METNDFEKYINKLNLNDYIFEKIELELQHKQTGEIVKKDIKGLKLSSRKNKPKTMRKALIDKKKRGKTVRDYNILSFRVLDKEFDVYKKIAVNKKVKNISKKGFKSEKAAFSYLSNEIKTQYKDLMASDHSFRNYTFVDAAEEHIKSMQIQDTTRKRIEGELKRYVYDNIDRKPLKKYNGDETKVFTDYLLKRQKKENISNRVITDIIKRVRKIYEDYEDLLPNDDLIRKRVIKHGLNIKTEEKYDNINKHSKEVLWTQDERNKFFEAEKDSTFYLIFETLIKTGMRIGELRALQRESLYVNKGICFIRVNKQMVHQNYSFSKTKTKKSRSVPISNALYEKLIDHFNSNDTKNNNKNLIFPGNKGKGMPTSTITNHYNSICKKAGVRRNTVHTFRKMFINKRLIELGNTLSAAKSICQITGHTIQTLVNDYLLEDENTLNELYELQREE